MAINNNKVALHLYLNNPYGLISAYIPNYTVNVVDGGRSPLRPIVEQSVTSFTVSPSPQNFDDAIQTDSPVKKTKRKKKLKKQKSRDTVTDEEDKRGGDCDVNDIKVEILKEDGHRDDSKNNNTNNNTGIRFSKNTTPLPHITTHRDSTLTSKTSSKHPYFLDVAPVHPEAELEVKSVRSRSVRDNDSVITGGSPDLGFTWSINNQYKRPRVIIPKKPPPKSLLEQLCGVRAPDPIGIVKVKQAQPMPMCFDIHKAILEEQEQKKMSERLSEWLDHYNEVSHRQQQYLQKIHDLRRGIQNKDEKNIMYTIDKMRNNDKSRARRKYPLYTMSRTENAPINQGPSAFPNRQSYFHSEDKKISPRARLEVNNSPRKLAPIVNKVRVNRTFDIGKITQAQEPEVDLSIRPDLTKMKTDYESFESIAKRNKLNLTQFFNSSLSHRRTGQRLPMSVSTVTIIDEGSEKSHPVSNRDSPVEYITDVSGKKSLMSKSKDKSLSNNRSLVSQAT